MIELEIKSVDLEFELMSLRDRYDRLWEENNLLKEKCQLLQHQICELVDEISRQDEEL